MDFINDIIKSISSSPGVYQFKDEKGDIIYGPQEKVQTYVKILSQNT